MRLDEVVRHFLKDAMNRNRTKHTMKKYEYCLSVLMQLLKENCDVAELEQVTILHLRECVQRLMTAPLQDEEHDVRPFHRRGRKTVNEDGRLSITSVRTYMRVWKAFFSWCYQEELIEKNVVARLVLPRPEKRVILAFSNEQVEKMLDACDCSTSLGFRDYLIIMLLLDTGMRLSEIATLEVNEVYDDYIKVFGKGRKEREIGIHPDVSKMLWKYIHKYRTPVQVNEKILFLAEGSLKGRPLGMGGIKQIIERVKEKCVFEDVRVSAHTFRHTFAKMYLEQGGDLFKLSRELGHSDVQVTRIYLEDFGSTEARKSHSTFSPIARLHLKKQSRRKQKE